MLEYIQYESPSGPISSAKRSISSLESTGGSMWVWMTEAFRRTKLSLSIHTRPRYRLRVAFSSAGRNSRT
jgi:hypothetical protein